MIREVCPVLSNKALIWDIKPVNLPNERISIKTVTEQTAAIPNVALWLFSSSPVKAARIPNAAILIISIHAKSSFLRLIIFYKENSDLMVSKRLLI